MANKKRMNFMVWLARRRQTLADWCRKTGVDSYEELCFRMGQMGAQVPSAEDWKRADAVLNPPKPRPMPKKKVPEPDTKPDTKAEKEEVEVVDTAEVEVGKTVTTPEEPAPKKRRRTKSSDSSPSSDAS